MRIGVDIDNVISTFNEELLEEFLKHNKELGYSDEINENADYITRGMFNWKDGEVEAFYRDNIERIVNRLNVKDGAKEYIDNLKSEYNVIVSGRALMEIYPKQDYHIFITADLEERVKRKCIQYNGYELEKEVRKNIIKRDKLQKLAGFYKIYPNTITVDVTECKSAKESAEKVYSIFCEEGVKNNGVH